MELINVTLKEGDVTIDNMGIIPVVTLSDKFKEKLAQTMGHVVVFNLLGRTIG